MKQKFSGGFVAVALFLGSVLPAQAITVDEFDHATSDQKGGVLKAVINGIYAYYQTHSQEDKAICVKKLYDRKPGDGVDLMGLIIIELYKARDIDPTKYKVEDIIFGVTESECTTN